MVWNRAKSGVNQTACPVTNKASYAPDLEHAVSKYHSIQTSFHVCLNAFFCTKNIYDRPEKCLLRAIITKMGQDPSYFSLAAYDPKTQKNIGPDQLNKNIVHIAYIGENMQSAPLF